MSLTKLVYYIVMYIFWHIAFIGLVLLATIPVCPWANPYTRFTNPWAWIAKLQARFINRTVSTDLHLALSLPQLTPGGLGAGD